MRAGPANLRFLTRLRRFGMTSLILELPEYKSFVELFGRCANPLTTGPSFPSSSSTAELCLKSPVNPVTLSEAKGLGWWVHAYDNDLLPRFLGLRASE